MADPALVTLLGKLKSWQPFALRVMCADGETRDVAVPQVRRRWVKLEGTLGHLRWVRVEALDKSGKIVGVYENPDYEAAELEDIEGEMDRQTGQVAQLVNIMLKAQDVALKRQGDRDKLVIDQLVRVVDILTQRTRQLEQHYAQNYALAQRALQRIAGEAEGEHGALSGDAILGLLEMWRGGGGQAPPNGAPPTGQG